jgi:Na+-driven multidrug efflux pump
VIASFTVFITLISRMGDVPLAASQVSMQIEGLGYNVCWGFAVAATTLVGQYLGAKQPALAVKAVRSAARWMLLYLLCLLAFITLFPLQAISLFSADPEVTNTGAMILYLAMTYMLFDGMGLIIIGALRGAGDTRVPMIIAVVMGWGFFLPLVYVFTRFLSAGPVGAWSAAAIYIITLSLAYFLRFLSGRWKQIAI